MISSMVTKNGMVSPVTDTCRMPAAPYAIPYPNINGERTSKQLKKVVSKYYKEVRNALDVGFAKYCKCPHCTGLIPSEASVCPTCNDRVEITKSTEFRVADDYRVPEICVGLATQIINMAYPIPSWWHNPTIFILLCRCTAAQIRCIGLVKLINQASGHIFSIPQAISRMGMIFRAAWAKPPGPLFSA